MNQQITKPALRLKMTGVCNRTCSFCNEEGDMRTIGSVQPDATLFDCVHGLMAALGISSVMLTGGEPTIHPDLQRIVEGIKATDISITTNGIRPMSKSEWSALHQAGLRKLIVSIHDASPQSLIQLETRARQFGWAVRALDAQRQNLATASEAGLNVRVNTVAYGSYEQVRLVLDTLSDLRREHQFGIRLLNDLANIEKSQRIIQDVCLALGAKEIGQERRAGSSNSTVTWETETGFQFSTKMAYRYFFDPVCAGCAIKQQCHEGFYGVRVERRGTDYWVRLCLYKQTPDVLMPWRSFVSSDLAKRLKDQCLDERR